MTPMTLDEAKDTIEHFHRHDAGRRNRAALMLLDALRAAEARAEAAEKRAANARREAFEEVARVADAEAAESDRIAKEEQGGRMWMACRDAERNLAAKIRALAPKPPAETDPLFEDVKRESSRPIPKQVLHPPPAEQRANERPPSNPPRHYADAAFDGAPHFDPEPRAAEAPFDARKALGRMFETVLAWDPRTPMRAEDLKILLNCALAAGDRK